MDARIWAAIRALHADFGAGAPHVALSEFCPSCGRWAVILDQSAAYLSNRLERLGAACSGGLERAPRGACALGRSNHGDPAEHLAGQSSDRVNALRCLSARQCSAKRGDFLRIPNHTGRVATGLQHSGCERAGQWQSEKRPGENGDGGKSIPAGFAGASAMATCRLGRWGWNGLSAASRLMSRMWEHRRFDFPECHIRTRIPERTRNLLGLQTSTAAEGG